MSDHAHHDAPKKTSLAVKLAGIVITLLVLFVFVEVLKAIFPDFLGSVNGLVSGLANDLRNISFSTQNLSISVQLFLAAAVKLAILISLVILIIAAIFIGAMKALKAVMEWAGGGDHGHAAH